MKAHRLPQSNWAAKVGLARARLKTSFKLPLAQNSVTTQGGCRQTPRYITTLGCRIVAIMPASCSITERHQKTRALCAAGTFLQYVQQGHFLSMCYGSEGAHCSEAAHHFTKSVHHMVTDAMFLHVWFRGDSFQLP